MKFRHRKINHGPNIWDKSFLSLDVTFLCCVACDNGVGHSFLGVAVDPVHCASDDAQYEADDHHPDSNHGFSQTLIQKTNVDDAND